MKYKMNLKIKMMSMIFQKIRVKSIQKKIKKKILKIKIIIQIEKIMPNLNLLSLMKILMMF